MRVHRSGPDGAPWVVLVHGIGVSSRYFRPLTRALETTHRVLSLDLPGFGASAHPRRPLTLAEHGDVVAAVMAEHGVRGATLLGHSLGGQVVVELLRAHPGAAARAVLVGPTTDDRARSAVRQGLRLLRDALGEPLSFVALEVRAYLACGPRVYLHTLVHMLAHRTEEALPHVAVPVLVARGAHDPVAPRGWVERLAATSPLATTAEASGGGHGVHYTHAEELARIVSAFEAA